MASPVKIRSKTGGTRSKGAPQVPVNTQDLAAAVEQLQDTVNELVVNFNAHTHSGVTAGAGVSGAPSAGALITGGGEAAANLFTTPPTS